MAARPPPASSTASTADAGGDEDDRPAVYGDAAYGSGDNLADLHRRGIVPMVKTPLPVRRNGMFGKDAFDVDLDAETVTCPAGQTVPNRAGGRRVDDYRATRPKVERKLGHNLRRGRRAARRGLARVDADWNLLGAAINLARLTTLGIRHTGHYGTATLHPAHPGAASAEALGSTAPDDPRSAQPT